MPVCISIAVVFQSFFFSIYSSIHSKNTISPSLQLFQQAILEYHHTSWCPRSCIQRKHNVLHCMWKEHRERCVCLLLGKWQAGKTWRTLAVEVSYESKSAAQREKQHKNRWLGEQCCTATDTFRWQAAPCTAVKLASGQAHSRNTGLDMGVIPNTVMWAPLAQHVETLIFQSALFGVT